MLPPEKGLLPLAPCADCATFGQVNGRRCRACAGHGVGLEKRGQLLFWSYPLYGGEILLRRARAIFYRVAAVSAMLLGVALLLAASSAALDQSAAQHVQLDKLVLSPLLLPKARFFFWLAIAAFCFAWYILIKNRRQPAIPEMHNFDGVIAVAELPALAAPAWEALLKNYAPKKRRNIAAAFSSEALRAIEEGYSLAQHQKKSAFTPAELFHALLNVPRVKSVFIRLAVLPKDIQKNLQEVFNQNPGSSATPPGLALELYETLFAAYESSFAGRESSVSAIDLIVEAAGRSPVVQEILADAAIDQHKLQNVLEWGRVQERLSENAQHFRSGLHLRPKSGLDRALTAVATPLLDHFSTDLTRQSGQGRLPLCLARDNELSEVFRIAQGQEKNLLLVGERGSGRKSIVYGLVERMIAGDVPERLSDKRLVEISIPALLAGTDASGAVERLSALMAEASRAGNIVLFIPELHELIGVSAGGSGSSLDVAGSLAEYLGSAGVVALATTTPEEYSRSISRSALGTHFTKIEIAQMTPDQALQVLESRVPEIEYRHQVFFSYDALEQIVRLAGRFIQEACLPGSGLEIMSEAALVARQRSGKNSLVTADEVSAVVAGKTKIPLTAVSTDESGKLLRLEEALHTRVIGQEEAVSAVASALRRARAELRSGSRPVASLLFLGPTGVGKTELVKTIAEVYFGGERQMIRLDMSEYQDTSAIHRLIGVPGQSGSGALTEALRAHPFALVLLDELEKSDKDVLNLFLQVMDDGRLTDSTGRTVDCTNIMLVATSNAGTGYVSEQLKQGVSEAVIKEHLLHEELKQYFRPEFINRFDAVILFRPLKLEDIKKIAGLLLKGVGKELAPKGIELRVEEAALDFLARIGFDPEFGARPLRRAVQETVENKLADLLLAQKLKRRDTVVIGDEGKITVE